MKKINDLLINDLMNLNGYNGNYYSVNTGINSLIYITNNEILKSPAFRILYENHKNFYINIDILAKTIIDYDSLGFASAKRTTRVMIEGFIDLFNLLRDSDYLMVMKKSYKEKFVFDEEAIYKEFMYNNNLDNEYVSFKTKKIIAKRGGLDNIQICSEKSFSEILEEFYLKYSNFSHANIFVKNEDYLGEIDAKKLILLNIYLIWFTFRELSEYVSINIEDEYKKNHNDFMCKLLELVNKILTDIDTTTIFQNIQLIPDISFNKFF